jgi:hypothetical protein
VFPPFPLGSLVCCINTCSNKQKKASSMKT